MGKFIVKPKPDEDFYVEWCTIVDNWVSAGVREEYSDQEDRLNRADQKGSSTFSRGFFTWDEKEFIVHNLPDDFYEKFGPGVWTIPRENLREFVNLTQDGVVLDLEGIRALLNFESYDEE